MGQRIDLRRRFWSVNMSTECQMPKLKVQMNVKIQKPKGNF